MNTELFFSSKSDEWATPPDLFKQLDDEFHFTLDAASSPENAKCAQYYTREDDGLTKPWMGRVWCNPPYGRKVGEWVEKAATSQADLVVMLLAARTDTKWFHDFIYHKAEIRFLRGRLKFGKGKGSAPFPSMIVIFKK